MRCGILAVNAPLNKYFRLHVDKRMPWGIDCAPMSQTTDLILRILALGKMSQIELSRRTGIPQPRLSKWQRGVTPDSADDVLLLVQLESDLLAGQSKEAA